jgi:hypothetical protein
MDAEAKPEIKVELDWSRSTLADWELVSSVGNGLEFKDIPRWIEFLDRVVVGGKTAFPMTALKAVIEFVAASLAEQMNPKAKAG